VDHSLDLQQAIAAPRIHSESSVIEIDDRFSTDVIEGLRGLGHQVRVTEKTVCSYNFANPVGVMVTDEGDMFSATDPMMPSGAAGLA
jgi:gamma-glutamyltranspeptidase